MSDYNVSIADFKNKNRIVMTDTLYQYDYGQKLQIVNIAALPQTFEAHFSNVQHGGVSITVTGMDGIVDIPNSLLMTGKRIYCWIYVTEPGSGETVYQILLPVQHRPMPEYYDVTDVGVFDSVVQQVGDYAATATAGATSATASATAAATSASEAAASASAAETAKNAAETAQGKAEDAQAAAETAAQTATQKAQQTAQDAAHAALDAGRAESAAGRAEAAETGAESAKTNAETAAQGAAASASAASASATSAGQAATSAGQSATAAAGSATTAENAAQTATTKAGEASASATAANTAKTAAQTAQTGAETAATNAGQSASTATAKAAEAAQSASSAAQNKTDAEAAATRAETAAASLTVDSALSDSSVNPVQNKVVTAEFADVKNALDAVESDIYTVSDNLFDFDAVIDNKVPGSVGSSPDTMVTLNNWHTSNYIPVVAGEKYALILNGNITTGAVFRVACYSGGVMTYKSASNESNPYTIPDGVDHIRFFSNTASLFSARTNTSFKKYSADMSKAWTPYGTMKNFVQKGALPEYGVYVDGSNYYHFVNFGNVTLIRLFKQEGPNNLFQYSATYIGEISKYGASIKETIATNGTDTVGPISIMRQGTDSGGMWAGGWHTRTVDGTAYPTARQASLDVRVNGMSVVGSNGIHYGEVVATVVNQIYFPQTITGADLSTATQAIEETVQYILNAKMTARVWHRYVADTRVILYYGMQAVRIGFDSVMLPNNETEITFSNMTENLKLDKAEDTMALHKSGWNYDLTIKDFGLAKYTHNPGTGANKYGSIPKDTRKIYWVLIEGTYDYSFIPTGKVLAWEGEYNIYPN